MLQELKKAKHFIFMEYFIIHDGRMWGDILEILKQKAKQGVEVRLLYDDFGSLTTLLCSCIFINWKFHNIAQIFYLTQNPFIESTYFF